MTSNTIYSKLCLKYYISKILVFFLEILCLASSRHPNIFSRYMKRIFDRIHCITDNSSTVVCGDIYRGFSVYIHRPCNVKPCTRMNAFRVLGNLFVTRYFIENFFFLSWKKLILIYSDWFQTVDLLFVQS